MHFISILPLSNLLSVANQISCSTPTRWLDCNYSISSSSQHIQDAAVYLVKWWRFVQLKDSKFQSEKAVSWYSEGHNSSITRWDSHDKSQRPTNVGRNSSQEMWDNKSLPSQGTLTGSKFEIGIVCTSQKIAPLDCFSCVPTAQLHFYFCFHH